MSTTRRQRRGQQMRLGSSALATIPLYFEGADGKLSPVGPLQSIGMLLEEQGEVSEQAIRVISQGFDDPSVVATALNKLGAIRVRKESGETVFTLGGDGIPRDSDGHDIGGGTGKVVTSEGSASMAIGFSEDPSNGGGGLVPLRTATRIGMTIGNVEVIRLNGQAYVKKADFDAFQAKSTRGNATGAAALITDKLGAAQDQRSDAHKAAVRARQASQASRKIAIANAKPHPGSTAH
jgi:hypothetical protein